MNFGEKFKFLNKHQIIFDLGRKKLFQKTEWKWNQLSEKNKKFKPSSTKKPVFQTSITNRPKKLRLAAHLQETQIWNEGLKFKKSNSLKTVWLGAQSKKLE